MLLISVPYHTISREQSPSWEAKGSSDTQEIPYILCNRKVHHRIQNSPPTVLILSQIIPVHAPSKLLEIHFNIILPPKRGYFRWSPSLMFPHQNSMCISPIVLHVPRTHLLNLLVIQDLIWNIFYRFCHGEIITLLLIKIILYHQFYCW